MPCGSPDFAVPETEMLMQKLSKDRFTTLGPDEIWKLYNSVYGIFRGGGNANAPKLVRADGPRRSDLFVVFDPLTNMEMVQPSATMGLSFADSIEVLARKKVEGHVWVLPRGQTLPEGLVFNIKNVDHPLLNVGRPMSVLDMVAKLTQLAGQMKPCLIRIDKSGKIIEQAPGMLKKASTQW